MSTLDEFAKWRIGEPLRDVLPTANALSMRRTSRLSALSSVPSGICQVGNGTTQSLEFNFVEAGFKTFRVASQQDSSCTFM